MSQNSESWMLKAHNGLQALSAIASSAQSFLGPSQSYKTVLDSDGQNGIIVSSCMELLQALDIQHPVGELLISACLAHHKAHGSCVTTLITMVGCWSLAVQTLLDQGVPITAIKSIGDECLQLCVDTAQEQAIHCNISLPQCNHASTTDTVLSSQNSSDKDADSEDSLKSDTTGADKQEELRYNVADMGLMQRKVSEMETDSDFVERSFSFVEPLTSRNLSFRNLTEKDKPNPNDNDDDNDDVNWYFEGSDGQEFQLDVELEKVRCVFTEFDGKSERVVPQHGENDWIESVLSANCDVKYQTLPSNLHLIKQEITSHRHQTLESDDDDFKNCFSDSSIPGEIASQTDFKEASAKNGRMEAVNSDEEFQDCIPGVASYQESSALSNSNHLYKTSISQGYLEELDDKYHQADSPSTCKETSSSLGGVMNDVPSERNVLHMLTELLGHPIGGKAQVASKKLLNNSRHFRTVESVVEQHKHEEKREIEGETLTQMALVKSEHPDIGLKDQVCLEQQLQSLLQNKLSLSHKNLQSKAVGQSRHFRTLNQQVIQFEPDDDKEDSPQKVELSSPFASCGPSVEDKDLTSDNQKECITDIWSLGTSLSHGSDREMRLAVEAYLSQTAAKLKTCQINIQYQFDFDRIFVCCITGPSEAESCIVEGLVLPVKEDQIHNISHQFGNNLNCLDNQLFSVHFESPLLHVSLRETLINGDLKSSMRHTGYKESIQATFIQHGSVMAAHENKWLTEVKTVLNQLMNGDLKSSMRHTGYKESIQATFIQHGSVMAAHENKWLTEVKTVLNQLQVGLLMTKGKVDQDLLDSCLANDIIVLQHIPYKALVALSGDRDIVTYITDATADNIITDVSLKPWECGWQAKPVLRKPELERMHYLVVNSNLHLKTAVIFSPTISGHIGAEDRFWRCIHRLSGAIKDGRVLPGAGAVEVASIRQLNNVIAGETKLQIKEENGHSSWPVSFLEEYISIVTTAFKDGFIRYLSQMLQNSADISCVVDIKCAIEKIVEDSSGNGNILPLLDSTFLQFSTDGNNCNLQPLHVQVSERPVVMSEKLCLPVSNYSVSNISAIIQGSKTRLKYNQKETIAYTRPKSRYKIDSNEVCDCYNSKARAWECAWEIVKTVLQTDCVIVSGINSVNSLL